MQSSMPVLKRVCSNGSRYDNIVLLNINHDMRNTYCFSAELTHKFGKVIQIGISYTASSADDRKAFGEGIYYYAIPNRDKTFSLQRSEASLRIREHNFVDCVDMLITVAVAKDVLPEIRNGKKLFIIEDGGYHSATIDNLEVIFPELEGSIIGSVEQTTSGTRILSSRTNYSYPSVSIARSEIKMCLESVFIGQKIVEELSAFISYTDHFLNFSDVCMIGYGIFGRAVARKLNGYRCNVAVCEKDGVIREAAEREGYPVWAEITPALFRDNQIFIAMTGNRSFGIRELEQYLNSEADNILLSSGSSKDVEYKEILSLIREPGDSGFAFSLEESGPYYERYAVSDGKKQKHFWLIANGMPVNFCRQGSISLTDKMIDLIFAEMTLCAEKIIESGGMKNALFLLGDSSAPVQMDEWALMREWFGLHHLYTGNDTLEQCLDLHPCRDYLRKTTFLKLSANILT